MRYMRMLIGVGVLFAASGFITSTITAAPITMLTFSNAAPNMAYAFNGSAYELSTVDDGNAATTGDRNAAVDYLDFLAPIFPDIPGFDASFSMDGLVPTGPATNFGGSLMVQNLSGGSFGFYSPANVLLLGGTMGNSALSGAIGPTGAGSLFIASVTNVTGGTLQPYILTNTLTLSMNITAVNGGSGFSLVPVTNVLNPFTMNAIVKFSAGSSGIPEPAAALLLAMGGALGAAAVRRRRKR